MRDSSRQVVSAPIDRNGVFLSAIAVALVALYPAAWYFAAHFMVARIPGSEVPVSVVFAVGVLFAPMLLVWRFVRREALPDDVQGETAQQPNE